MEKAPSRGTRVEEAMAGFAAAACFVDFVYTRPVRCEQTRKIELCDLLIEIDNIAICLQIKAQDAPHAREGEVELKWMEKHLARGVAQLNGAIRVIKNCLYDVEGTNSRRGLVKFPSGKLAVAHGIALVDYKGAPVAPSKDIPRRSSAGVPIHCLNLTDFMGISQHLGSLPDLIRYLSERSRIPAWSTPKVGAERDTYAYFLTHGGQFEPTVGPSDFDGCWQKLNRDFSHEYAMKLNDDRFARLVDEMIDKVHEIDPELEQYLPEELKERSGSREQMRQEYIKVAIELNRLPKIVRREIGKRLLEKAELSAKSGLPRHFAIRLPEYDLVYVFLVTSRARTERIKRLFVLVAAAMAKCGASRGLGVAAPDTTHEGFSFDFILRNESEITDEIRQLGETCFKPPQPDRVYDFPDEGRLIILPDE